jgi:hypothetical protein
VAGICDGGWGIGEFVLGFRVAGDGDGGDVARLGWWEGSSLIRMEPCTTILSQGPVNGPKSVR